MEVVQRPFPRRATTTPTPRHVGLVVSETLSAFIKFGDCAFAVSDSAVLSSISQVIGINRRAGILEKVLRPLSYATQVTGYEGEDETWNRTHLPR
jgi:hypothetical protein